ncbi:MAG: phosphotransferase [Alphaproteobacteria bacterium]|nr:phosphotransferase [Alphaproteobacteria bacterium]
MRPDIRAPQDVDVEWLSLVLAEGGVDARVESFSAKKVGTGQIGDCVRFALRYGRAPDDAPATLVGKFPSSGAESRAAGVSLGNYHREVKFYQVLQARARIATPRCYFTDVNEETHDFVLMMGDLAPAEQGDQLTGASLDETRIVLVEAAKMHAAFWQDDALDGYAWVNGSKGAPVTVQGEAVAQLWHGFVQRYGDRVTERARRIGDAFAVNLAQYDTLRQGPRALIHADFRPDNMLFAVDETTAPVTVVDWQSFGYGPAATDIGYFIAGALDPAVRKREEKGLLELYLEALEREGGGPYAAADFHRHYVTGAYQHFLTAFFAAMLVTQTPRGDDMFFKMLNGAVDLIADHGAEDWLA